MKPVQILLLVIAGALGGAVLTKVWQRPQPKPSPAVAEAQQPAQPAAPAPAAEPVPPVEPLHSAPVKPEPAKPSPTATRREAPKPQHTTSTPPPANPRPVEMTARVEPKPAPQPTPTPAVSAPPARPEPEHATPAPPAPNKVTLNSGVLLPVRLVDGLSSERNMPGDSFTATLDKELVVDGFVIAERGARVEGRVVGVDRGGKVKGTATISVELTRIHTSDGQNVPIQTDAFERRAEATHRTDAEKVGAGAAVGAIIGAIAGGGKGAAIGAGVGGGAGAGDVLLTRGKPATLPTETRISFRLRAPVTVTEQR